MRILVVVATPPWPARSGYQIRCAALIERMARGHEVRVLAGSRTGSGSVAGAPNSLAGYRFAAAGCTSPWTLLRSLFDGRPHHARTHATPAMAAAMEDELARRPDVAWVHYLYFADLVPRRGDARRPPVVVLDQHNLDHDVWEGRGSAETRALVRTYFHHQGRRVRALERETLPRFDSVLCVSSEDAAGTQAMIPGGPPPRIVVAPNGVDTFAVVPRALPRPGGPPTVVFTGTAAWRNVEGLSWFLREAWPLVRASLPQARLVVAGRFDPRALVAGLRASMGLEFTGEVESVLPALQAADVAVVPVREGGGTKLKVLEALAAGLPSVLTVQAARGLDVEDGKEVLVRADGMSYAAAVIELLSDHEMAARMGRMARVRAVERYGWDGIATGIETEFAALLGGAARSSTSGVRVAFSSDGSRTKMECATDPSRSARQVGSTAEGVSP